MHLYKSLFLWDPIILPCKCTVDSVHFLFVIIQIICCAGMFGPECELGCLHETGDIFCTRWAMIILLSYLRWNRHFANRSKSVTGKLWMWQLLQIISMCCVVRSAYLNLQGFLFLILAFGCHFAHMDHSLNVGCFRFIGSSGSHWL